MPYGTGSKMMDDKVERCVNAMMEDRTFKGKKTKNNPKGDRKLSAILMCKASVMKANKKK
jgi:hypothetical protein